jgi:hypothetical protein
VKAFAARLVLLVLISSLVHRVLGQAPEAASPSSVALTSDTPPDTEWPTGIQILGHPADSGQESYLQMVSEGYFSTLGVPLLQGRIFTRAEILRGAPVVIVNRAFVKHYLNSENPIGRGLTASVMASAWPNVVKSPNVGQPLEIVGIVEDSRNDGLHRPVKPQVFAPYTLLVPWGQGVLVRTASGNPARLLPPIAAALMALNQDQAIQFPRTMDDSLSMFAWSHERFTSVIFVLFATVALTLAMIGLFSVVAYTVEQRTREIGIRVALGARRSNVLALALSGSLMATAAGLAVGVLASIFLSNTIYKWTDSTTRDTSVLLVVSAIFLLTTLAACLWPANRALRVDPLEALRAE